MVREICTSRRLKQGIMRSIFSNDEFRETTQETETTKSCNPSVKGDKALGI